MKTILPRNLLSHSALLLSLLSPLAASSALAAEKPKMPAMPVEAQIVQPETLIRSVELVGSLSANESVMISPEVSGRIASINFKEGQLIQRGQTLFTMDSSIQRAELKKAEASRSLSQIEFKRADELYSRNAGSENARDTAQAKLQIDEASVSLAKERVAQMNLTASFDGLVGLRSVSLGEYVTPGQALVNLVAIDPLRVEFRVPELYLTSLAVGQKVDVKLDAVLGEVFTGEVFAISPEVDTNGRSVKVVARVDNSARKLRPGLFARVNLQLQTLDNVLMVQEEALVPQGNAQLIYTLVEGKVKISPVRLGIRERGRVQVVEGLNAGDIVVTAGQMKLRPGAAAMPINLPKAPAATSGQ
ncbi:membrane fusion protein, multidrug efflux system [Oceanospirillum multiglobuliferum]|uniref:Uncharacterized protein n=1 Tax=Oceanospirillum multiglobuliferum TaxID=64969 RepID=A0A1T4QAX2_9GAMM|nr:efflux RND transporter periplasmic adaptor subunit [Oceanospirillum multiglobuliferum]OPX56541.1 hypothetical protein BTE48_03715 [Oceanospirillum multiglobuliferum]SKA00930.1 membrane fusion protein, multidrug efflux system [Oceanospirillum multiglobuliferum]